MTDKLEAAFKLQHEMQIQSFGTDPAALEGEDKIQFFKDMKLALQDELHEALQEMGWKPWATSKHFHTEAVQGELVDAFHFFMNLCIVSGLTPEKLYEQYLAKRTKNQKRQAEGYDGVSTKCPGCKRALDDEAVHCRLKGMMVWCEKHVTYYPSPAAVN
jgi:hypothetical protein